MKTKALILTAAMIVLGMATQAKATEPVLDGHYRMDLKIGDRVFVDQLDLRGEGQPLSLRSFVGPIAGLVTVPGIFSSALTGQGQCSEKTSSCTFDFVIVAHEGGQDYKVLYHAELTPENYLKALSGKNPPVLSGAASLEDGQVLGPFEAIKQ